jgi:hypothetical protein
MFVEFYVSRLDQANGAILKEISSSGSPAGGPQDARQIEFPIQLVLEVGFILVLPLIIAYLDVIGVI